MCYTAYFHHILSLENQRRITNKQQVCVYFLKSESGFQFSKYALDLKVCKARVHAFLSLKPNTDYGTGKGLIQSLLSSIEQGNKK